MTQRKLFGTDGIRGKANKYPLTPEMVVKVGQATALAFKNGNKHPKVIIGKDTRITGYVLETALTSGLCSMGADVILVGPVPTPAVAHLVKSLVADVGIVLTASHNPAGDNGIKYFSSKGVKIPDEKEMEIEKLIFSEELEKKLAKVENIGKAYRVEDASGRYIEFAKHSIINYSLSGLRVVLDCANGASYKIAPKVFKELGAEVISINTEPDGLNINLNCGATSPQNLSEVVTKEKADIGMAYDGDADRLIVVDEKGNIVDGDTIIYLIAKNHQQRNVLKNDSIVVTQYSNLALDAKLKQCGIKTIRVENGDRYVIDEMIKKKIVVGGEKSGHIILSRYSTTGDGIISSLHIAKILQKSKKSMSELASELQFYPQVLENLEVKEKRPLDQLSSFMELKKEIEESLGSQGRVFVRYSGTENLCRIMIEGKNLETIKEMAKKVKETLAKEVGL
ncbi:MAG: phosphoglucosamine mutase [Nanoarchaeota archaeon]